MPREFLDSPLFEIGPLHLFFFSSNVGMHLRKNQVDRKMAPSSFYLCVSPVTRAVDWSFMFARRCRSRCSEVCDAGALKQSADLGESPEDNEGDYIKRASPLFYSGRGARYLTQTRCYADVCGTEVSAAVQGRGLLDGSPRKHSCVADFAVSFYLSFFFSTEIFRKTFPVLPTGHYCLIHCHKISLQCGATRHLFRLGAYNRCCQLSSVLSEIAGSARFSGPEKC